MFFSDTDREVYLRLAASSFDTVGVRALAYCLMTNHVHWVVTPISALARAFGALHGRYAQHVNAAAARSGHLWQNRFFSCALDEVHTWAAVRYVEENPVRAALVNRAECWRWSSASARLSLEHAPLDLDLTAWRERFTADEWRRFVDSEEVTEAEAMLRVNTYTGRPAGEAEFVRRAEVELKRTLRARNGGRPRKVQAEPGQRMLFA